MKAVILVLIVACMILGYVLYRSRSASQDLDVEPHAAEEIRKAQRR